MLNKPCLNTGAVKAAETLEPGHGNAGLELLEANGALGVVDAVLPRGRVGEDAGPPRRARGRGPVRRAASTAEGVRGPSVRVVSAVLRDAVVDVRLALGLKVW